MSKTNWTPQQIEAFSTKYRKNGESCNILVSAAAGSGKTAVLTRRVIKKLAPDNLEDAIPCDKLLVVTFTNAAAHEMSERIGKALRGELELATKSGDMARKKHIKHQMLLLANSEITTIDAFCLRLIRSHFNLLDIDPGFSIADESHAKMLSEKAMEEVFEELYKDGDEDFINLLCLYGSNRSDEGLSRLILAIYKFISSIPHPFDWLREKAEEVGCPDGIEKTKWFEYGYKSFKENVETGLNLIKDGLRLMIGNDFTHDEIMSNIPVSGTPYYEEWKNAYAAFFYDYSLFKELSHTDFKDCADVLSGFSFKALTFPKTADPYVSSMLKDLRARVRDIFTDIKAFVGIDILEIEKIHKDKLYPTVLSIVSLCEKYHDKFMELKLSKNVLEFHDIEQLTLTLLTEHPEIAEELKEKYEEVLMDEYQDTSLLQEAIFTHVSNGKNLFMVGDMKQSIYRFRNSDPTIFKSKNDSFKNIEDAENRKIVLSKNFRSRASVLDSVNDVFEAIMSEKAGELIYDDEQKLYAGNTTYLPVNDSYTSECCIVEGTEDDVTYDEDGEETELSKQILEARFIASEINRLKNENFQVRDGHTYRKIENRDIVILMSSFKSAADSFISELNSAGIECFVENSGYFDRSEIRLMLALFKVINNPYSDIPLLGIMRSPIASFTDDELVIIRKCKKGKFYGAVKALIKKHKTGELSEDEEIKTAEKAETFCENLNRWRKYSRFMSSDKLVWTIYEESDFYAFCGSLYDGEEAQANLRLLFERAKQYEENGFRGLFNFIKYIENIKKRDEDISTAKLIGEGHNVVRIMTIHKSKGLEFPVVFVAGGNNRLKSRSDDSRIMLHKDFGIAMEYINFEESYTYSPPAKAIFKEIANSEQISEDIRKLYVAMTRAKEKLYFVGFVSGKKAKDGKSKLESVQEVWQSHTLGDKVLFTPKDVLSSSSFADWVCPVALSSGNWLYRVIKADSLKVQTIDNPPCDNETLPEINLAHILDFSYQYKDISNLPTKISVSELKGSFETQVQPMPDFLTETKESGTSYGTCIHKIMENLVPKADMTEDYITETIDGLTNSGILEKADAKKVLPEKILAFYQSDVGKRIMASKAVHREQHFEVEIGADEIYPELPSCKNETILLQGVIDCYFEEDDGIVLVDYKTDKYKDVSEIHEKYDTQLALYAYALEKITKKPVKDKFIYLFFDNNVI